MDMYRRNDFRSWFDDVGFIYLIVIAFVALTFLLKEMSSDTIIVDRNAFSEQTSEAQADGYPDRY